MVNANHTNFVNQLRVSPDNNRYVTVSSDKKLILRDVKTHETTDVIDKAHTAGIYDTKWLSDELLATCSADNTLKIWSVS